MAAVTTRLDPVGLDRIQPHTLWALKPPEDPWKKAHVLTLDGGGIRGYASLWILKYLMDAVKEIENNFPGDPHKTSFMPQAEDFQQLAPVRASAAPTPRINSIASRFGRSQAPTLESTPPESGCESKDKGYLPCHYFDYITGTSTGGLNAIMLGRLRMSVEDSLELYPTMAQSIFTGRKRSWLSRAGKRTATKYDATLLEEAIKKIVDTKIPHSGSPLQWEFDFNKYPYPGDLCKTLVIASSDDETKLFRSYNSNSEMADNHQIWEVARATSAAPTFFDPIVLGDVEYFDGGVGNNNPVEESLREIKKITKDKFENSVEVLVSLGTGQKPSKIQKGKHRMGSIGNWKVVKQLATTAQRLSRAATDAERGHKYVKEIVAETNFGHYYRWTGGEEVGGLALDEWEPNPKSSKKLPTATFIEDHVKKYMMQGHIKVETLKCAQELVNRRRSRIAYEPELGRWIRHTYCTLLPCPYCKDNRYFENREVLKHHIEKTEACRVKLGTIDVDVAVAGFSERFPHCSGGPF